MTEAFEDVDLFLRHVTFCDVQAFSQAKSTQCLKDISIFPNASHSFFVWFTKKFGHDKCAKCRESLSETVGDIVQSFKDRIIFCQILECSFLT